MTGSTIFRFNFHDIVSWGNSGLICLDKSSNTVVKSPHDKENNDEIAIERSVYERFKEHGSHEGLLRYYGPYDLGIRLEFACNGNLRRFLKRNTKDISIEQRFHWAAQIADVLCFVHSTNVVHGDVSCGNILLDGDLNAKLSDFGGSSLDGSPLLVAVTPSHRSLESALSIQGDIFALGSTLYEIMIGDVPYHQLSEEEIRARYSINEFPETKFLGPIGGIIASCWCGQYDSFEAIFTDIKGIQRDPSITPLKMSFELPTPTPTLVFAMTTLGLVTILSDGQTIF